MKKKKILGYAAFCFAVFFLMLPDIFAGQEDWEVLNYYFGVDTTPRHQRRAEPVYNPVDNEFVALWHTEGILRDDCDPSDEYECTHEYHSIDGRRISPDGEIVGEIQLFSPVEDGMNGGAIAHNMYTNEYLTATPILKASSPYELYMKTIDSVGNPVSGPEIIYPGGGGTVMLPILRFNHVQRNYFLVYNDKNVFNSYLNNIGFILDENGNPVQGPFEVGNQVGDEYASRIAYNPTDDTYLVVWEDFRNVRNDWTAPCDIYGALIDGGGGMITEIAVMDDVGMENEGNQRVPVPVYNPDKNEFLVVYKDEPAGIAGAEGLIMGRIIKADGTPAGDAFLIVDPPRIQHWPDIAYIQEEKKYFMVWNDMRNDGQPAGSPFYSSPDIDVYGSWLDSSGQPIGEEILIADAVDWQFTPHMAYNPVMKRLFIGWYDRNPVDDYEYTGVSGVPFAGAQSDVRGTIYGVPSFLSGRVIEEGTGEPVEGARIIVIGLGLLKMETSNIGGWWNIPKDAQGNGRYLIIARKNGYSMAIQSVTYAGEALQATVEIAKR
jgi:hypothetical protein